MAYSVAWDEATPSALSNANQIATFITNDKIAVRERIDSIFGTSVGAGNSFKTTDPYVPASLSLTALQPIPAAALAVYTLALGFISWIAAPTVINPRYATMGLNNPGGFTGYRYNNTYAVPTAIVNNDQLSFFSAGGYDGTNWSGSQGIVRVHANENWNVTSRGTRIDFLVTLNTTLTTVTALSINQTNSGNYASFTGQVIANIVTGFGAASGALAAVTQVGFTVGLAILRATDTNARLALKEDGIYFGPGGATAQDTSITRNGANGVLLRNFLTLDNATASINMSDPGGAQYVQLAQNTKYQAVESGTVIIINSGYTTGYSLFNWSPGGRQYSITLNDAGGVRAMTLNAGNIPGLIIDGGVGAAEDTAISVYDITGVAIKRVSRGAANSGGAGFRLLRIAN